jgi:hypothetical protein
MTARRRGRFGVARAGVKLLVLTHLVRGTRWLDRSIHSLSLNRASGLVHSEDGVPNPEFDWSGKAYADQQVATSATPRAPSCGKRDQYCQQDEPAE